MSSAQASRVEEVVEHSSLLPIAVIGESFIGDSLLTFSECMRCATRIFWSSRTASDKKVDDI